MNDSSAIHDRTDYYELFGVEETATQDQLKKAYRKAAMRWHPDRNHDNITEATRVFQIIEHAYSILSDPHERAWYDGHRHAVVNELGEFSATNVDIEGLFSAGAFTGFNDGPNGFYAVFQDAFRSLSEEESSTAKFPLFGDSNSPYEKVTEFYNFWTCFTTKRSFAFKDIYRLKDAPNGRYKRAMNQENEKVRQKAQREFVQSVRELALFAKKRDPRVKKHLEEVEKQNEEKRKIAEKKKLERQKEVEKQLQSILNDNSNPISYNENDIIYLKEFDKEETEPQWHCDYCGRDMNTESAFKQHCNTKKHKKLSATARKDFLADPSLFEHTKYTFMLLGLTDHEIQAITGKSADEFLNAQTEPNEEGDLDNEEEEEPEFDSKSKKGKKQNQKKKQQNKDDDDDDLDNETASNTKKGKQNKKQNQNQKNKKNINGDDDNDNDEQNEDYDDEDEFQNKGKNKNNQGKKGKGNNNNNKNQNQNKNNQQKIPKKEKHKQKMQRQKEAREKAELEELEKQRQKEREEKEKIESIISKSQSSDIITDNENENENENENNSVNSSNSNFGPKLSKKEKKRLRQLEEARKRLLIQEAEEEEEEEKKENEEKGEVEDLAPQIEEEEEDKAESNENIQQNEGAKKKDEKVIEIIDENGQKVKVTLTDNFDDVEEKEDDQAEDQAQNQTQNQKNQNQNQNQPKGKNKKGNKGPKRAPPGMFMCRKCHAVFPSKTKLFKHLEETNHATAYG